MNNGWIKLHRKFTKWEWYDDPNTLSLWIHILLSVNYERKQWHGHDIEAGQMVTSYAHLAKESGLSVRAVRTALDHLKLTHEVTCESTNKYTLITVVKWADFQADDRPTDTQADNQATNERQSNDNQTTTTKEYKEHKEIKNKRNIFVKPSFDEVAAYINENMFNVKPDVFYDYYEANGWMVGNKKMKDWKATVRNWDRRESTPKQKPKQEGWAF